jgi:glycosyltransferase involved in cell wall biosynthesis
VYKSLLEQTFRDFEWLIVDDGSTDGTETLVKQWQQEAEFPIRYYWQPNSGKHVAFNRAVERAMGELFVGLDSDDWLAPNALERMLHHWQSIPPDLREGYVGVAGLCAYSDGKIVGTSFPQDVFDADAVTIRTLYRVEGDKFGMNRTDVLRQFPFPEDLGRFVTEAIVWRRIARQYKERYVNEIFAYKEYQEGGLTDRGNPLRALRLRVESAPAMRLAAREFAEMPHGMVPLRGRLKAYANFVRWSLHSGVGILRQVKEAQHKQLVLCVLPLGIVRYLKDKQLLRRNFQRDRGG